MPNNYGLKVVFLKTCCLCCTSLLTLFKFCNFFSKKQTNHKRVDRKVQELQKNDERIATHLETPPMKHWRRVFTKLLCPNLKCIKYGLFYFNNKYLICKRK